MYVNIKVFWYFDIHGVQEPIYIMFNGDTFMALAKEYKLEGFPFRDLCIHNRDVRIIIILL